MEVVAAIARVVVGALFLYAAWWKLRAPRSFVIVVVDFQVMPPSVARLLGWWLPFMEAAVGFALIVGVFQQSASLVALLFLAAFSAAIAIKLLRGRTLSCGCFGSRESKIGPHTLVRNAILMGLATLVAVVGTTPASIDSATRWTSSPSVMFAGIVALISGAALAALLTAFRLQTKQSAALSPKLHTSEPQWTS